MLFQNGTFQSQVRGPGWFQQLWFHFGVGSRQHPNKGGFLKQSCLVSTFAPSAAPRCGAGAEAGLKLSPTRPRHTWAARSRPDQRPPAQARPPLPSAALSGVSDFAPPGALRGISDENQFEVRAKGPQTIKYIAQGSLQSHQRLRESCSGPQ